jgi:hypothetical protein
VGGGERRRRQEQVPPRTAGHAEVKQVTAASGPVSTARSHPRVVTGWANAAAESGRGSKTTTAAATFATASPTYPAVRRIDACNGGRTQGSASPSLKRRSRSSQAKVGSTIR